MLEFKESKFYKLLQDFFINNNKETFLQMLGEFYNRTEGIIDKNKNQDELIKELRELYIEFNEKGIDENIVIEKVNQFVENNVKIKDILAKLVINTNKIEDNTEKLSINTSNIENIFSQLGTIVSDMITKTNSDYIDIRWLGATPDTDCHDIIMSIINRGKTVYIPKGVWRTSPLTINTKFQIIGESFGYVNKYNTSVDYSVLAPFSNQTHLIEVEGIREESEDQIRIDNVVLSCVKTFSPLKLYNVDYVLKLKNVSYGTINTVFNYCSNTGLILSDCWEISFPNLYFRGFNNTNPIMVFDKSTIGNISQCLFSDIQFEGCYGTLIKAKKDCKLTHCIINNILFEGSPNEFTERVSDDGNTLSTSMFEIEECPNLIIDNITINNLNSHCYKVDGETQVRKRDNIFKVASNNSWVNININNIVVDMGTNYDYTAFMYKENYETQTSVRSVFINNFSSLSEKRFYNKINGWRLFVIKNLITRGKTICQNKSISEWYTPHKYSTNLLHSADNLLINNENSYVLPLETEEITENNTISSLLVNPGEKIIVSCEGVNGSSIDYTIVGLSVNGNWNKNFTGSKQFTNSNTTTFEVTNDTEISLVFNVRIKRNGLAKIYDIKVK